MYCSRKWCFSKVKKVSLGEGGFLEYVEVISGIKNGRYYHFFLILEMRVSVRLMNMLLLNSGQP